MKKHVICAAVMGALVLAGCGNKQDADEKNFSVAVNQYIDNIGGRTLCLGMGFSKFSKWPVDIRVRELSMWYDLRGYWAALESTGLVTGVEMELDGIGAIKRYNLTEEGKKFYIVSEETSYASGSAKRVMLGDICYGKASLDKIVKWEGPFENGQYQEAKVTFLYKIDELADWAKTSEFKAAFPAIAHAIDGAGKDEKQISVKLTSIGWEPM